MHTKELAAIFAESMKPHIGSKVNCEPYFPVTEWNDKKHMKEFIFELRIPFNRSMNDLAK